MTGGLDPDLAAALALLPEGVDPGHQLQDMNLIRLLRSTVDLLQATGGSLPTDDRVHTEDGAVPGPGGVEIPVRVYRPIERPDSALPCVVFFHGGAFVLGDVYTEEMRCLQYAAEARCMVISVGYRLAPEDPYPAAVDDGYAALTWAVDTAADLGIDPARVAVAGSSAGGALAAAMALMARDAGGPAVVFQLLNYPVVDDRMTTPSMRRFDDTPLWTRGSTADMWQHYLGDLSQRGEVSPYAAPARAHELTGLPPAYVATAELDPLRDEGIEFARRLLEAGVPTELHSFAGACHGFDMVAPGSALGRRAIGEQTAALVRALHASEV